MRDRDGVDGEFEAYVRMAAPALLRLAVLLTGNLSDGEELFQEALARVFLNWSRVSLAEYPDAYVRRVMVNTHRRRFRRQRVEEMLVRNPQDRSHPADRALGACRGQGRVGGGVEGTPGSSAGGGGVALL